MFKLEISTDKCAIYLNHRVLINNAFKSCLLSNTLTYTLKPELFHFVPKTHTAKPSGSLTKRKRKHEETKSTTEIQGEDLQILETYLKILHTKVQFELNTTTENVPLTRIWEESYQLPQLNGANATMEFQEFHAPDNVCYIIPPACRFYNYDVQRLTELLPELPAYDLIILDPPWRNKYIRRLKRAKQQLGYAMLYDEQLAQLPVAHLTHERTLVAIWCTNSKQHQDALLQQLLPNWNLRLLHALRWYKINTAGKLIGAMCTNQKQPYEMLYIACHKLAKENYASDITKVELLLSVPSIVHSHKPPLMQWLCEHVAQQQQQHQPHKCLELFARYLQPECTSIGLEVLKLMDKRLYENQSVK